LAKGLQSLIRLHRWQVDEHRRRLAELTRRAENLHEQARRLEREIAEEQARSRTEPLEAGTAYADYARAAIDRRAKTAKAIEAAETDAAAAGDALGEAYRALRTLETAQADRERRRAMEEERRERIVLDEVGIQGHRRRSDLRG
jgi:flagellar biosynthesis chaperone FliJ